MNYTRFLRSAARRRQQIIAMHEAGKSQSEIARLLGLSRQRVHQIIRPQAKRP